MSLCRESSINLTLDKFLHSSTSDIMERDSEQAFLLSQRTETRLANVLLVADHGNISDCDDTEYDS